MIVAEHLSKRFGSKNAVSDVSFTVSPGVVTGFLGPNGAGKSTTMRMIVGLDRPTSGEVTVNGQKYSTLVSPLTEVGVLLDAKAVHTGRSARGHLRAIAATHGIPRQRVDEVLDLTGLTSVSKKRVGGFSLGMGQRLGIAAALLGDPRVIVLDEPVNGLDPDGVIWMRSLIRHWAAEGRTVLISSHLMSEMQLIADHIIVLGRGRVLAQGPVSELVNHTRQRAITVRTPDLPRLLEVLNIPPTQITVTGDGLADIVGFSPEQLGDAAAAHGLRVYELTPRIRSLEDAYLELTGAEVEYRTTEASA